MQLVQFEQLDTLANFDSATVIMSYLFQVVISKEQLYHQWNIFYLSKKGWKYNHNLDRWDAVDPSCRRFRVQVKY